MVLSPAPIAKPKEEEPAARALAYEQAISQRGEAPAKETVEPAEEKADIPPFETAVEAEPSEPVDPSAVPDLPPDESADVPDEGAPQDMAAVEDGTVPGQPLGTDGAEQWGDESDTPWASGQPDDAYGPPGQADPYGPPGQGGPYGEADPYGPPAQDGPYGEADPYGAPQADQWGGQGQAEWTDQNGEQWVEVIISGAAMRATASEDAPMLFAFPYGRSLKVVSRYEGWVEVTDPKSSATGWMEAHALAPSSANRQPYGQNEAYYDDPRQRRGRGWIERNADDFADMLNRAFGGGGN